MRIAIEGAFEPIEIDLWGSLFETQPMPRSRARKARVVQAEITRLSESEPNDPEVEAQEEERLIELYGELFDLKLKPAGGGRRKPSTLLKQRWEGDKLTGEELAAFLVKLTLAEQKQLRDDLSDYLPEERPT